MIKKTTIIKKPIKSDKAGKTKIIKQHKYFEAIGRRKTAIARVRIFTHKKEIGVNDRAYLNYFPIKRLQEAVIAPLKLLNILDKLGAKIKVKGGGLTAQAEAVRLGIARALLKYNPDFKKRLHKAGFLKRDPRMVERKKYGLRKARRAPQWAKR